MQSVSVQRSVVVHDVWLLLHNNSRVALPCLTAITTSSVSQSPAIADTDKAARRFRELRSGLSMNSEGSVCNL